jgi:hypothetical protein
MGGRQYNSRSYEAGDERREMVKVGSRDSREMVRVEGGGGAL